MASDTLLLEPPGQPIEHHLEQHPGALSVGVGEGGLAGGPPDTEVVQPAQGTGHPVADLAQGLGLSKLAEQHGHEVVPAREPLAVAFGADIADEAVELMTGKEL